MKMNHKTQKQKSFEHFLTDSLQSLPKEIEQNKDLWPGIDRAINYMPETTAARKSNKFALVAACFAGALFSFIFIPDYLQPQTNTMQAMSQLFENEKSALLVQYQGSAPVTSDWQNQLKDLEQAENAIKKALENDPQSSALLGMLSQVYRQQLELINKVHKPQWQQI